MNSLPALQERFFFLAKRFVAGETVDDAIGAVQRLNDLGMLATIDFLGEDVHRKDDALAVRAEYLRLLDALADAGALSNISLKLTALGLLVDRDFCVENLTAILDRAANSATARAPVDPFVRIDMEGSALTDATLGVFESVFPRHPNVGVVLQAYLHRTPADVARMVELGARVRLCKGAYKEPAAIAFKEMAAIRREFVKLAETLLSRGNRPAIATHDERIQTAVKALALQHGIGKDTFEFQMLYGVRPDLQRKLVAEGYTVRVYVPYGTHWAAYFYRRVTERRENALLALRALVGR
ncbi:MAG: proline dehydrogenase family protein [Candidatus Eremiobacteraeota bacterium]|nr:proline dehydrogenase family protein [Candidatus Eremiobacteraeota bacterium]